MPLGQHRQIAFSQQRAHLDPGRRIAIAQESQIKRSIQQRRNLRRRYHLIQSQFNLG